MQGIPENPTLASLSRGVLPGGMLAGGLPGGPTIEGSNEPQANSNNPTSDGDPNENGIKRKQEVKDSRNETEFGSKDISPSAATAKLINKNRIIARLDIVCLFLFPIVFVLYGIIYLMSTCL